jgi:hypothetical protein
VLFILSVASAYEVEWRHRKLSTAKQEALYCLPLGAGIWVLFISV